MARLTALTRLTKLLVNWQLEDHRRHYWEEDDEWRKDKHSWWRQSPFVTLELEKVGRRLMGASSVCGVILFATKASGAAPGLTSYRRLCQVRSPLNTYCDLISDQV